jgi:hypothetical protein
MLQQYNKPKPLWISLIHNLDIRGTIDYIQLHISTVVTTSLLTDQVQSIHKSHFYSVHAGENCASTTIVLKRALNQISSRFTPWTSETLPNDKA